MATEDVIIVGAGGHAKVVIELLRQSGFNVAYCISGEGGQEECLGIPILVGDAWLDSLRAEGFHRAFVAIGANRARLRMAGVLKKLQYELVNAISPFALISPSARFGVGIAVMAGAIINAEAEIGDLAILNTGSSIDHDCRIGQAAHIAPQCALAGMVTVGEGGFMGIGSCAIPEVSVGKWSIVGAGAVVIKDIPDSVVAFGIPARQVRSF
jgi:UDP-perosamine 4-acetyltransferase